MRFVQFKNNVRIKRITPALIHFFYCMHRIQNKYDWLPELVITSANDSQHSPNSRHFVDEAWDIRTHYFVNAGERDKFLAILELFLNHDEFAERIGGFTILLESVGSPNEHIHVQVKKGESYP